tara:strand:+ start:15216 stop:15650 length:435 start_codon:yes stop_codon:yes gene_type:complete
MVEITATNQNYDQQFSKLNHNLTVVYNELIELKKQVMIIKSRVEGSSSTPQTEQPKVEPTPVEIPKVQEPPKVETPAPQPVQQQPVKPQPVQQAQPAPQPVQQQPVKPQPTQEEKDKESLIKSINGNYTSNEVKIEDFFYVGRK